MENRYVVVVNHEQRYSIWPATLPIPKGWSAVGEQQGKQDCLNYIEQAWTDMRPISIR
ncbi:MbtH family protein [Pseudoalteromonas piscicida]|uniref:MbtH family protein n=1 Tax=Pseudoalteromonas piscicida TaxID=43662 RepID=UPI00309D2FE9